MDSLPVTNQKYNDSIFRIAVYKLIDQEPGSTPANFIEILPTSRMLLKMNTTTIDYPREKKVHYLWIYRKLVQLLLWTENRRAKDMGVIDDDYKISMHEVNENILKFQQIMSDYANHLASRQVLLRSDQSFPAESSTLPSYQSAITGQANVGTSNSNLTPRTQQGENLSGTNGHAPEIRASNPFQGFKLPYCFDGSNKLQARDFINDYDCLALRNKWLSEEKLEFFPNHLEKDALTWYISIQDDLTSWKALKTEFMLKYLFD